LLLIRQNQLHALSGQLRVNFESRLCDLFMQGYPRECHQAGGRAAMLRWTEVGVSEACAAGYRSQHACGRWLLLMMMLGIDFAIDPQLPWIRACLDPSRNSGPTERIDEAVDEAMHYLGAIAGEDAERVVRAMVRIRDFDFASVPSLQGPAAVDEACARLKWLYPEKFDFQGEALMADFVASQLNAARQHGLAGPAGGFLFVLLAFMLGTGFHRDPLHSWAVRVLDPAAQLASDERAARLEAAARMHMALSFGNA